MKNSTFYKNLIWLCLFKFALLFTAFASAEFNLQIQSAFHQSVKTELVESRIYKPDFSLNNFKENRGKTRQTYSLPSIKSFNIWSIINLNNLLEIKLKSYRKKNIYSYNTSTKVLFKIPSPESLDEVPSLSLI